MSFDDDMAGIGHNSGGLDDDLLPDDELQEVDNTPLGEPDEPPLTKEDLKVDANNVFGVDGKEKLEGYIQRIENLEEEKANLATDIREIMAEMKATGFDTKIVRQVLKLRKMKEDDRREMEVLLDAYKQVLGMD